MRQGRGVVAVALAATFACAAAPADAQQSPVYPDPMGYCVPERTDHDPRDLERERPPVVLPPGWSARRVRAGDLETAVYETGPRDSAEAIVFLHGTPGNSFDWLALMQAVPPGARAIALDGIGFGQAQKPWDYGYTLADSTAFLDRMFTELGISRVHLVGHDTGSIKGSSGALSIPTAWPARRSSPAA